MLASPNKSLCPLSTCHVSVSEAGHLFVHILPYFLGTILAGFLWLPSAEDQGQSDGIGKDGLYLRCWGAGKRGEHRLPLAGAYLESNGWQAFVTQTPVRTGLNSCFVKS